MVSVHNSSEVGRWFEPQSGKKKTNHISICCFFAKNAILRWDCKDWYARNEYNVSGGTCCFSEVTLKIQLIILV